MEFTFKVTWVILAFLEVLIGYFKKINKNPCDLSCLKKKLEKIPLKVVTKKTVKKLKFFIGCKSTIMDFWDLKFWDSEFFIIVDHISKNAGI